MEQTSTEEDWKQNIPHRRFNPLSGTWILCSPHRAKRPWLGQVETTNKETLPQYDPKCYLCPRNKRAANYITNPDYQNTFVFTNDFSALLPPQPLQDDNPTDELEQRLLVSQQVSGRSRVICFSPRHDLTLAQMEENDITEVVKTWKKEYEELGKEEDISYVQIFENKGAIMGCSNPHPHCQIWASSFIPQEPQKESESMQKYLNTHGSCMLCDYAALEKRQEKRVVAENEMFIAVVPYWGVWPYELLVLSKSHIESLSDFTEDISRQLANILKQVTCMYDNLFEVSFPYTMGIHQSPTDGKQHKESHFHMHFDPPLLRSATVKKFMVGYEMLAEPQRDLTVEQAAARLKALSGRKHYSQS